jgi:hypothetical protein
LSFFAALGGEAMRGEDKPRPPSLFKEGQGEFQIRSNALCPSLSKRDDGDAIKRSPSLSKEGQGEFKVRFNAFCPSLSKRDDADGGLQ